MLLCPSCQAGSLFLQEVVPGCDPSARPCAPSSPPSACRPGGQDGTFARTGPESQRLASRLRLSGHPRCPHVPRGTTGPGEVFSQMRQVGLTSRGALLPPEPGIHLRRSSGWWGLRESGQGLPWEMASLTKQDVQEERVPLMGQILSAWAAGGAPPPLQVGLSGARLLHPRGMRARSGVCTRPQVSSQRPAGLPTHPQN